VNRVDWDGELWNLMCELGADSPIEPSEADLMKSFVYCRKYGLFYVSFGKHNLFMSFLQSIEDVGVDKAYDYMFNNDDYYDIQSMGEKFLKSNNGVIFRSGVQQRLKNNWVNCWTLEDLNLSELIAFESMVIDQLGKR
jgi:hypothetical protein